MDATQVAEFEALLELLNYQRLLVDYAVLSCCMILFYDYILTWYLEYKYIWRSKWGHTKILFLLTRYTPMINAYFILYDQLAPNTTVERCHTYYHIVTWLLFMGVEFAEVILALRTWAVWRQNRWVGIGLAFGLCCLVIVSCVSLTRSLKVMELSPIPYFGYRGCFITHFSTIAAANFISLVSFDLAVLTLMCLSALQSYRHGPSSQLMHIIHRDGIMFYFYLLLIAIANITVFYGFSIDLQNLMPPWYTCLCSVFTSRIILNIRAAANVDCANMTTDLHSHEWGINSNVGRPGGQIEFQRDLETVFEDDLALAMVQRPIDRV